MQKRQDRLLWFIADAIQQAGADGVEDFEDVTVDHMISTDPNRPEASIRVTMTTVEGRQSFHVQVKANEPHA